jgi:hypothetical protein
MEPITTIEGYNTRNNPREARRILADYYERLGYKIVDPVKGINTEKEVSKNTNSGKGKSR